VNSFSSVKSNPFYGLRTCTVAATNAQHDLYMKMIFEFFKVQ